MPIPFLVKSVKNLSYKDKKRSLSWKKFIEWYSTNKAKSVYKRVKKYIVGRKILDVGFGAGTVAKLVVNDGFEMKGLDVADLSIYKDLKAELYDGHRFPFKTNSFDTAIIIHVLHHCEDGLEVLREAKRCAKRVIFIEDTYRNKVEKAVVSFNDNIGNWEFYQHPYKTVSEWKKTLKKEGMKLVYLESWSELSPILIPSRYCLAVIE